MTFVQVVSSVGGSRSSSRKLNKPVLYPTKDLKIAMPIQFSFEQVGSFFGGLLQ